MQYFAATGAESLLIFKPILESHLLKNHFSCCSIVAAHFPGKRQITFWNTLTLQGDVCSIRLL